MAISWHIVKSLDTNEDDSNIRENNFKVKINVLLHTEYVHIFIINSIMPLRNIPFHLTLYLSLETWPCFYDAPANILDHLVDS